MQERGDRSHDFEVNLRPMARHCRGAGDESWVGSQSQEVWGMCVPQVPFWGPWLGSGWQGSLPLIACLSLPFTLLANSSSSLELFLESESDWTGRLPGVPDYKGHELLGSCLERHPYHFPQKVEKPTHKDIFSFLTQCMKL